jgi:biopolymer transport protein ExbD
MRSYDAEPPATVDHRDWLTRPIGLAEHLTAPRFRVDSIAFADLAFICLLVLFLSQSFLFSPGVTVELPTLADSGELAGVHADAVATVWNRDIVTVQGSYPFARMDTAFRELMIASGGSGKTLLLLATRTTPLEDLTRIYESAREAGFQQVQIGAKPPTPDKRRP